MVDLQAEQFSSCNDIPRPQRWRLESYWYSLPDVTLAKCHGFQESREKDEVCGLRGEKGNYPRRRRDMSVLHCEPGSSIIQKTDDFRVLVSDADLKL